jgi:hypothetical protein
MRTALVVGYQKTIRNQYIFVSNGVWSVGIANDHHLPSLEYMYVGEHSISIREKQNDGQTLSLDYVCIPYVIVRAQRIACSYILCSSLLASE